MNKNKCPNVMETVEEGLIMGHCINDVRLSGLFGRTLRAIQAKRAWLKRRKQ